MEEDKLNIENADFNTDGIDEETKADLNKKE